MSFYLDTSYLISVLSDETNSDDARNWLKSVTQSMILSDLAALEFAASVSRFLRTRRLDEDGAALFLERFDEFRSACESHVPQRSEYTLAEDLVRDFATKLAAPDALHLASAIKLGATLVTFDQRLAEAAISREIGVVTP